MEVIVGELVMVGVKVIVAVRVGVPVWVAVSVGVVVFVGVAEGVIVAVFVLVGIFVGVELGVGEMTDPEQDARNKNMDRKNDKREYFKSAPAVAAQRDKSKDTQENFHY